MPFIGVDRLNFTSFKNYYNSVTTHDLVGSRIYAQTDSPGSSNFNFLDSQIAAGFTCCFSFKSSFSWSQVAAGNDDTRIHNIGAHFLSVDPLGECYLCFNHEPENDTNDGDTAFQNAQIHIYNIIRGECNTPFGQILMGSDLPTDPNYTSSHAPYTRWFVPSASDFLGVDWYNLRGSSGATSLGYCTRPDMPPRDVNQFQQWIDIAVNAGVPRVIIPESTCYIRDPATFPGSNPTYGTSVYDERTVWYSSLVARYRNEPVLEGYFHYNQDKVSGFGTSRLDGGTQPVVPQEPLSILQLEQLALPTVAASTETGWGMVL